MAGISGTPSASPFSYQTTFDDDSDATASKDLRAGATTLYGLKISQVTNGAMHLKLYDAKSPVIGTTVPDFILPMPTDAEDTWLCPGGAAFATGLSWATVSEAGTAGTTAPATPIDVWAETST